LTILLVVGSTTPLGHCSRRRFGGRVLGLLVEFAEENFGRGPDALSLGVLA
jgi:hypothetical protein